jgi:hypothetical protein
MLAVKT